MPCQRRWCPRACRALGRCGLCCAGPGGIRWMRCTAPPRRFLFPANVSSIRATLPCVRRPQQLPASSRAPGSGHGDRVMRGVRDAVIAPVGPAGSKTAYGGPRRAWPLTARSKDLPVASGRSVATRSRMRSGAVHRCAAEPCSRLQAPAAPSLSAALVDRCATCGRRPGERATDEARSAWWNARSLRSARRCRGELAALQLGHIIALAILEAEVRALGSQVLEHVGALE